MFMRRLFLGCVVCSTCLAVNSDMDKRAVCAGQPAVPSVTFVLPVFNRSFVLKDAIQALFTLKFKNSFEVVALDNDSCDNTYALLKKIQKRYDNFFAYRCDIHQKPARILNEAIAYARGIYICPITVDYILNQTIERAISDLRAGAADAVILQETRVFENFDETHIKQRVCMFEGISTVCLRDLLADNAPDNLDIAGCVFTKTSWLAVGGFPEGRGYNLWGFLFKLLAAGYRVRVCNGTSYARRQWQRKEGVVPLWDYDTRYGIVRGASCKGLRAVIASYDKLFRENFLAEGVDAGITPKSLSGLAKGLA